jgi:hypothetical protein
MRLRICNEFFFGYGGGFLIAVICFGEIEVPAPLRMRKSQRICRTLPMKVSLVSKLVLFCRSSFIQDDCLFLGYHLLFHDGGSFLDCCFFRLAGGTTTPALTAS